MFCTDCESHHPAHGEVERGQRYEARCQGGDGWVDIAEVVVDDRPRCPRCGTPMNAGTAFLCDHGAPGQLDLPPTCPSRECAGDRDREAIRKAIAAGVIDP